MFCKYKDECYWFLAFILIMMECPCSTLCLYSNNALKDWATSDWCVLHTLLSHEDGGREEKWVGWLAAK